mgnify:CR=1 FL=1
MGGCDKKIMIEKRQITSCLPVELKKKLQQEAERKSITLRIPNKLYEELEKMSRQTGLTVTSLLLVAIWKNALELKC